LPASTIVSPSGNFGLSVLLPCVGLWKFWLVGFSSLRGPLEIWLVGFASLRGPLEIWLVGFASLRGPLEILDCRFTAAEFLPLNWPSQVI